MTAIEAAEKLGVSRMTVYNAVKRLRSQGVLSKDCKIDTLLDTHFDTIKQEILRTSKQADVKEDVKVDSQFDKDSVNVDKALTEALTRQIESLEKQIDLLTAQLEVKDQQISELMDRLDNEQKLHAMTQQRHRFLLPWKLLLPWKRQ